MKQQQLCWFSLSKGDDGAYAFWNSDEEAWQSLIGFEFGQAVNKLLKEKACTLFAQEPVREVADLVLSVSTCTMPTLKGEVK